MAEMTCGEEGDYIGYVPAGMTFHGTYRFGDLQALVGRIAEEAGLDFTEQDGVFLIYPKCSTPPHATNESGSKRTYVLGCIRGDAGYDLDFLTFLVIPPWCSVLCAHGSGPRTTSPRHVLTWRIRKPVSIDLILAFLSGAYGCRVDFTSDHILLIRPGPGSSESCGERPGAAVERIAEAIAEAWRERQGNSSGPIQGDKGDTQ